MAADEALPLRIVTLLAGTLLVLGFLSLAPGVEAREVACSDVVRDSCEGFVCVDADLDGRIQYDECEPRYCTCDPQPQPW